MTILRVEILFRTNWPLINIRSRRKEEVRFVVLPFAVLSINNTPNGSESDSSM